MELFSRIVTAPKFFKLTEKSRAILGFSGSAQCFIENTVPDACLASKGAKKIEEKLFSLLDSPPCSKKVIIRLSIGKAPEGIKNPKQGYRLTVSENMIDLCGFGEPGLFYACVTLCQLLKMEGNTLSLPCLEILDYPDMEKRGHQIESRFGTNKMELSDWKEVIDDMAEKKQNILAITLYGCWSIQYDGMVSEYVYYRFKKYPKLKSPVVSRYFSPSQDKWIDNTAYPPIYEQNFFGEIAAYAKENGIEVVPFINTYGHNSHIPSQYPEVSAKFPDGRPTGNGYCTSNPKTYELIFSLFDDVIDNCLAPCGLTSFDIGMDEIGDDEVGVNAQDPFGHYPVFCRCKTCESLGKTKTQKFIDHAVKMISYLKSRGMKTVYICNDMFYRQSRLTDRNLLPLLYKALRDNDLLDVTALNWWGYSDVKSRLEEYFSVDVIKDSECRAMIKPLNGYYHWNMLRQSVKNSYLMAQYAKGADAQAYCSYSGWDKSYDRTNSLQATFSWNLEGSGNIENATRRYAERLWSEQADKAYDALRLLDVINEEGETEETNSDHMAVARKKLKRLSTRTLVERYLAYYFYSYLRDGMEYPEDFPTRAVNTILSDRALCEKVMKKVLRNAKRAEKIFGELARDPSGDMVLAARYAADSDRYICLLNDYFAILRMHDLSLNATAEAIEEMRELASSRINARKVFMKRYEDVKEHYLMPSHMRNMSIFLQFFKDVAAYLEKATPENFSLSFQNLSPIASEQFKKLR